MLSDPRFTGQKRRKPFGGKRKKPAPWRIVWTAALRLAERSQDPDTGKWSDEGDHDAYKKLVRIAKELGG